MFSDNKVNKRLASPLLESQSIHCILPSSLKSGFLPITENLLTVSISFITICKHFLSFSFLLAFWVWLFVVEMKNLKNNAYSIQKLWMGEWRCQLYVHYMFWCNQKHWKYVVLRCKNKSISDIAVLLLKIKPLQNYVSKASKCEWEHCAGFPVVWHHLPVLIAEIWTPGYVRRLVEIRILEH